VRRESTVNGRRVDRPERELWVPPSAAIPPDAGVSRESPSQRPAPSSTLDCASHLAPVWHYVIVAVVTLLATQIAILTA
jgi:hypothetical protein